MTTINFPQCCEDVKDALAKHSALGVKDIQGILRCSLPSTRKYIRAMMALGILYEVNGFKGKRYVKESPGERCLIEMQELRDREVASKEVRRRKNPMVFLCKGKSIEGNRIFQECKTNSPIQRMDDLLRTTGKFY